MWAMHGQSSANIKSKSNIEKRGGHTCHYNDLINSHIEDE